MSRKVAAPNWVGGQIEEGSKQFLSTNRLYLYIESMKKFNFKYVKILFCVSGTFIGGLVIYHFKEQDGKFIPSTIDTLILYLTFVIIFWYTYETYLLRKNAQRDNWGLLQMVEDISKADTNFIGLLYTNPTDTDKECHLSLYFKNIGNSPLTIKDIKKEGEGLDYSLDLQSPPKNPEKFIGHFVLPEQIIGKTLSPQDMVKSSWILFCPIDYIGRIGMTVVVQYSDSLGTYIHRFFCSYDFSNPSNIDMTYLDKGKLISTSS